VPNQRERASRRAGAAVSAGSPVLAAQAMWASGPDQQGIGWPLAGPGGVDVDTVLPVPGDLAEVSAVGEVQMHTTERGPRGRVDRPAAGRLDPVQQTPVTQQFDDLPVEAAGLRVSRARGCRSSTSGRTPARPSSPASIRPAGPAPTMITSASISATLPHDTGLAASPPVSDMLSATA
jgi:hypothetical protein